MKRVLRFGIYLLVVLSAGVFSAEAQPTGSSLRGYVKDNQGGVLPGVTVTATSPQMIAPATGVTDETGYYRLINQKSGKCLDVASASTANGANVIQYTCGTSTNQQWQWVAIGSYFQLKARHSGKCLDVVSSGTADGTDIQQYTCGSGNNQQWSRTQS